MRLLFISDFTEQFAYNLLRGVMRFSQETEPWVVQKLSPAVLKSWGLPAVLDWAVRWRTDVVIGQFEQEDDLSLFTRNGIVVFAQDYKERFSAVPNITGDYIGTGRIAADYYAERGFRSFAFIGYRNVCWSTERCDGFRESVEALEGDTSFSLYDALSLDRPWYNEAEKIALWLRNLPKPAALFACDDNVANLVLEIAGTVGVRVPDELSVLGVDNDEVMCNLTNPSLSSIRVDIISGGYLAAMQGVQMLNDRTFTGPDIVLQPVGVVTRGSTSPFATTDAAVLKALDFIKRNVHRRINVQDVLKVVPLSRRLLEIRFKEVTGMTLYSYISLQRTDLFAERLLTTKDSVNEIAIDLDEPDVKSISRRFKAIKGCTPSEYREKALRKL